MRIEAHTLKVADKQSYVQRKAELEVAIRAIEILEGISRSIRQAGGGHDVEGVGDLTIKEFAILAARNNIELTSKYVGPNHEPKIPPRSGSDYIFGLDEPPWADPP